MGGRARRPREGPTTEGEAAAAVVEDRATGCRAEGREQVVAHHRPAPEVVGCRLAPPLQARSGVLVDIGGGRRVDRTTVDGVRTWLSGFGDAPSDDAVEDVDVAVVGGTGSAHGRASTRSAGAVTPWSRLRAGLRTTGGERRIAHLHTSTPSSMDETVKGAVDLQP